MAQRAIEIWRGEKIESVAYADVAVVDSLGQMQYWLGDPSRETFWRSSAKPFQAMPLMESGAVETFGLNPREIAITCASHGGEDQHVELVEGLLAKIHASPQDLICGVHAPSHADTRDRMLAGGVSPSVVHNNCSGKHTGMLALARMLRAPLEGYQLSNHPVQRTILEHVAMMCGIASPQAIYTGIDGCGVPTFYLPLERMAYAYARLVDPRGLDVTSQGAAMLISEAIRTYPDIISGTGRLEVTLAEAAGHRLVSKGGAEAVFCLGIPERGLGVAVKMADGMSRTIGPLVSAVLAEIGVLNDQEIQTLAPIINPVIKNHAGREVGFMRPAFRLNRGKL